MKTFTLLEMIFVLILMGILSIIAVEYIPDNTLSDDTKALKNLINEKKSFALAYEANMSNAEDRNKVCIDLNADILNQEENNSKIRYFFKSKIVSNYNIICFDKFGRVFHNGIDFQDANLLHQDVNITLIYKDKNKTIIIHPITGFVE